MKSRNGFVKIFLIIALVISGTLIAGTVLVNSSNDDPLAVANSAITFRVFEDTFVNSVNEVGDIESSQKVEIKCNIKSRGRSGSTIIELIPEGTKVKAGDFLAQLDDSLLREELTEQQIRVARDKATVIQSQSILDTAKRKLHEFENGMYQQELAEMDAEIMVALENEKRAADRRTYSEALNRKGYLTKTQLQADIFAEQKAKLDRELAEARKRVYEEFTQDRMVAELTADIRKQEADLEASEYTLKLSLDRENEWKKQVANCRIVAPSPGTLVYANDSERRDSSVVIEEGAVLRDNQPIFYLPDPDHMQVKAKVNDSKINKVKVDQRVEIRVDTAPDTVIAGRVKKVSSFPNPRRYYQAPIEYDVYVEITESSPLVRSGLRAKVEIFVEKIDAAIQAPLSSLLVDNGRHFVLVKSEQGISPRAVEIGSNNEKFVVIEQGLAGR